MRGFFTKVLENRKVSKKKNNKIKLELGNLKKSIKIKIENNKNAFIEYS